MLLLHAAVTWCLVGLIWTIQLVHYPLFDRVPEPGFRAFHEAHARRITWIVAPLMAIELVTGVLLAVSSGAPALPPASVGLGLALLVVVWASTALLQVPLHARLGERFTPAVHRALVGTNWLRTVAWTARGGIAAWMLAAAGGAGAIGP
ncbi:MAG: hypothetical protein ACF8XB_06870 [Planctomycetota bacterium JB042]